MKPQIDAVTLGVRDLNRAKHFYEHGLGGNPVQEAEGFAAFSLPGISTHLALYSWDALAADAGVDPGGEGFRATALSFIVEDAESVDALVGTVRRAGGSLVNSARSQFWGGYSGYVADPDGHAWEIAWNPAWSIDPNGLVTFGI
jgi:catechol 2,3-dioxygenase-like lactoylglutathione lyase family enzyme